MLEKLPLSEHDILSSLKLNYGIDVDALVFLPWGADMNVSVYKAFTTDHISYFVKLKRGHHHDTGVEIVELLHNAGIQEVIPAIKTNEGRLTQPIENFTLIVYPFVEGKDGFNRDLTDNQWIKLGKALRQIHEIAVPRSIVNKVRKEAYSPKWREFVQSLFIHFEAGLSGDDIALKLWKFMKDRLLEIHRLVDRAEQLGQILKNHEPKFVLCHSDIHGGNVLLDGIDTLYIVDWDDPIMAPKERDLMFIGGGVANVWNKPRDESLFYEGYGKTEIDQIALAYYRHERIVEDIAEFCQALLLTRDGGEDRQEMLKQFIAMFEPQGVVEIAFKTDVFQN